MHFIWKSVRHIAAFSCAGVILVFVAQPAMADTGTLSASSIAAVLGSALLGGLILNLMPCVLPILSLKVMGIAHSGESRQRARSHALWYTAGVLVAFAAIGLLVVGLRSAGEAIGWGFQLQQPAFVAALSLLMFAVGLSLSGVFTLGGSIGGVGQRLASRTGPTGDFFTGVLACLVASPCIAPFMGPALAYAFTSPAPLSLLVFLALGLGLALPFLLIGFVPALAKRLPKPGAWMETLKLLLAFPMYLTATWLAWVLGKQRGVDALALLVAGAVMLALGLWWFERSRWQDRKGGKLLGALVIAVGLMPIFAMNRLAAPSPAHSVGLPSDLQGALAYSARDLAQLRKERRNVFVSITADWCITCKANEQAVLRTQEFRDTLQATATVYMKGDWTNSDPAVGAFLEEHKSAGVPLYVLYRHDGTYEVLPQVLTQNTVRQRLAKASSD